MMSHSNSSVTFPNGNGPIKVPLSEKNSNMGLTIDMKSLPYPGPLSPLMLVYASVMHMICRCCGILRSEPHCSRALNCNSQSWQTCRSVIMLALSVHYGLIYWCKGSSVHAMARSIFCVYVLTWYPRILHHGLPATYFFLPSWPMSIKAHIGRLLLVLALGIYTSSFAKDVACVPRPYTPDRKSTRLNSSHPVSSRMPSSA